MNTPYAPLAPLAHVSASSLSLFSRCPRKWAYRYLEGIKEPTTESQEFGLMVDGQLTDGILKGTALTHPAAKAAWKAVLPRIVTAFKLDAQLEVRSNLSTGYGLVPFLGYLDFVAYFADHIDIYDWKTRKSDRYAPTEQELLHDIQMCNYANILSERHRLPVTVSHVNIIRDEIHTTFITSATPSYDDRMNVLARTTGLATRVVEALASWRNVLDAPPDLSECTAFGGCFHYARCPAGSGSLFTGIEEVNVIQLAEHPPLAPATPFVGTGPAYVPPIVATATTVAPISPNPPDASTPTPPVMTTSLDSYGIPTRAKTVLEAHGLTFTDLARMDEADLKKFKGLGAKSAKETVEAVQAYLASMPQQVRTAVEQVPPSSGARAEIDRLVSMMFALPDGLAEITVEATMVQSGSGGPYVDRSPEYDQTAQNVVVVHAEPDHNRPPVYPQSDDRLQAFLQRAQDVVATGQSKDVALRYLDGAATSGRAVVANDAVVHCLLASNDPHKHAALLRYLQEQQVGFGPVDEAASAADNTLDWEPVVQSRVDPNLPHPDAFSRLERARVGSGWLVRSVESRDPGVFIPSENW